MTTTEERLLDTNYKAHELPTLGDDDGIDDHVLDAGTDPVVYTAHPVCIKYLEAENSKIDVSA